MRGVQRGQGGGGATAPLVLVLKACSKTCCVKLLKCVGRACMVSRVVRLGERIAYLVLDVCKFWSMSSSALQGRVWHCED